LTQARDFILVEGARQNNLKGFQVRLPLHELIVVTGVSGSGKSSLAFDTIYAEGQRRYVETFSPYARQFLDRMDKPQADRIEGIPPAIAIDQTNPVRTSRSTVGTMTELNDHLKLLFARVGRLYCRGCDQLVRRDTPNSIYEQLSSEERAPVILIVFPVSIPDNFSEEEIRSLLARQGYTRIHRKRGAVLEVVQDRIPLTPKNRARVVEGLEAALKYGRGRVDVLGLDEAGQPRRPRRFSTDLHCADCDIHYEEPIPNTFSFNSPIGACAKCRGFGRTLGIDYAADPKLPRMPGRPDSICPSPWHPYRCALAQAQRSAQTLGSGGRGGVGESTVVWRKAVLRLAREEELQDAHPGAPLEVPLLRPVPGVQGGAAEARSAALANWGELSSRSHDPGRDAACDRAVP
jgi:excinuclease UvrABC ATPase subunit